MQDVYDFFFDVNSHLIARGLERLDDTLRPAIMSGVLSDMLTARAGCTASKLSRFHHRELRQCGNCLCRHSEVMQILLDTDRCISYCHGRGESRA